MELPRPEVRRCFFDKSFEPPLPAMALAWDHDAPGLAEHVWYLPGDVTVQGPAPDRFGVTVHRVGADSYRVRLLWNGLCLSWEHLTRVQVMTSALAPILAALGTDLWHLLNQPIEERSGIMAA